MELVRGLHNLRPHHRGCVATIGNFDGVHAGHQAILKRLSRHAARLGLPGCVVIFEPQPREYFAPHSAPPRLTRLRDKLALLEEQGVDRVLCLAFNRRLRELSADEFIQQVLIDGLGVKHLEVGDDFRFGCDRAGDFALLQARGQQQGFTVESASTVAESGERISSSRVRQVLAEGDFAQAERLLGRPFSITGRVLHGQKLGRTLGAPTANVQLKRISAPLNGVYRVSVELDGTRHIGAANIGSRPSVDGDGQAHLEVHLLDFDGDLYGRRITVVFHEKLRDERKFDSLDELQAAIKADFATARAQWAAELNK
ncbi:MAG TPA: bifunctional riboflavin kinase/FAD synthetase [Candidatus Pseudomonas excrementavium]|uniref:bifunctional riboflavin kinase/FAD synthetase n=1 Tax=Halopseudomonas bauzanensis TaxID=653930 RepID=UPI001C3AE9F6|nr:bifunctional riboflavin kinase/FAD synthetase [Halopseudomonas bauzanensis]HIZ49854.1 bifunctional riboflavin kinase/FAD synthetase [Candidatus Pseudomonas excrementavium]